MYFFFIFKINIYIRLPKATLLYSLKNEGRMNEETFQRWLEVIVTKRTNIFQITLNGISKNTKTSTSLRQEFVTTLEKTLKVFLLTTI